MGFFDKTLSFWDIGLVKLAVVAGVLFILTMWTGVWSIVAKANPWYYLVAFVIFAARPFYSAYIKD